MLQFIDKLAISFAPLAKNARSARTFLYQVTADRHREANPKLVLAVTQNDAVRRPMIEVLYRDKTKLSLDCSNLKVADIVKDVGKHAKKLQLEEDIKSSS
ncbi:hypothetical protein BJ741DRAFT_632992 [Chytriomyces cf. hyalinus JEL632]|nr:hypothetical protein BJ741DRAFT_632992 [Chytriomyces cf. hyalinus JEL632]